MLKPNPINNIDTANSIRESEENAIINPNAIEQVAQINVKLVLLAKNSPNPNATSLEIPKIKYNIRISFPDIERSFRNAGNIVKIMPNDAVQ